MLLNLELTPEEKRANSKFVFKRDKGKIGNYGPFILTAVSAITKIWKRIFTNIIKSRED